MTCTGAYTCGKCAEFLGLTKAVKEMQLGCEHRRKAHYANGVIQCEDCLTFIDFGKLEGIDK